MLSSWRSSTNVIYTAAKSLLSATPNLLAQQTRNTVIVRRKFPPRLHKKGGSPRRLVKRNYIYEVVENTTCRPMAPMDIILTEYVEGFGEKGTKVSLKPHKAYNEFLLPGLAVYASPENIEKYLIERKEKTFSSLIAPLTQRFLNRYCLLVNMSVENPWVIERWHIRANFRKDCIYVTDESITLPEKEIKGPNLDYEGKEFYITVTINKTETVQVRCRLHHDSSEYSKQLALEPDFDKIPGQAIFPEDQEVLDSMPRPKYEDRMNKNT